jgi:hypothetical protein
MNDYAHRHPTEAGDNRTIAKEPEQPSFWRSTTGLVTIGFLVIGAFFLIAEHRAHVIPWLPWLILLACPLLHVFMHGGNGGHGGAGGRPSDGGQGHQH